MEGPSPAYYAVIVADVRYDKTLKPNAKLLYGELTALCNQYGYCWATNEYFAGLYSVATATVSRWITQLEKRGYIRCEMTANAKGSERRIYAGAFHVSPHVEGIDENVKTPLAGEGGLDKKVKGGVDENVKTHICMNNTSMNNTPYSPPTPPEGGGDGRSVTGRMTSHTGDKPTVKPPKASKRRREAKAAPDWKPERFAGFWDYYPRGESKQAAIRAWDELQPSDELIDEMARALARQMETEDWQNGIGVPYAATWLRNRRWTDVPKSPKRPAQSQGGWADDPEVLNGGRE